jgi:hypothetical protein
VNASPNPEDLLTIGDAAAFLAKLRRKPCSPDLIAYYERTDRLACARTRGRGMRLFLARHVAELARTLADADAARVANGS